MSWAYKLLVLTFFALCATGALYSLLTLWLSFALRRANPGLWKRIAKPDWLEGRIESGEDIVALQRFVGLTQVQFARALSISPQRLAL
jgi:hypothetical protein